MLFGVDVASVAGNKNTNWQLAKAQGPISFALVRATQSTRVDPHFVATWPMLKNTGLVRGAYMFLNYPNTEKKQRPPDAAIQAQTFVDTVGKLEKTDLPPALDIEFPGGRAVTGMTAAQALDWARVAWSVLKEAYGAPPIIYTSGRVWRDDLKDIAAPDLIESPLWLARYFWKGSIAAIRDASVFADGQRDPPVPKPWGTAWAIHQYQGDALGFPGFSAKVDVNRFNVIMKGSKGDLVGWLQRRLGLAESRKVDETTSKAIVAFQKQKGLVADGIVGPRTFAALCWN